MKKTKPRGVFVMNKEQLVSAVAESTGFTKKDATKAVEATIDVIGKAIADGDKVQLIGFGTFETRVRSARSGRNPQTGETIQIPEAKVPAFKPGAKLKDAVK